MDRNLAVCVSYATFAWHFTAAAASKKSKRKRNMYILFLSFQLDLIQAINSQLLEPTISRLILTDQKFSPLQLKPCNV